MNLFVFGLGYSALHLVRTRRDRFGKVAGTVRSGPKAEALRAEGVEALTFGPEGADPAIPAALARADAVLVSIAPGEGGDPVLAAYGDAVAAARPAWIGYLSTVGIYGDHGGAWVDEATPARPVSRRSRERVAAEEAWAGFGRAHGLAVHIFRLAGIYGPGRNALVNLASGRAKRLVKPGQVFNRIHVEDIARTLEASMGRPRAGAIYNVTDDEPAPPQDVVAFAAGLAGVPAPPEQPFDTAELTPMARSFYGENKRVSNRLLHEELGVDLAYPTYREALRALRAAGEGP